MVSNKEIKRKFHNKRRKQKRESTPKQISMHCADCGKENIPTAMFCQECGKKLARGISHSISKEDISDDEATQQMKKVPSHLTNRWNISGDNKATQQTKIVPSHLTSKWATIDNNEAIKKMKEVSHHFSIDVVGFVVEAPEKIIRDHTGRRAGATLLGGILLGPIGAMTGYAATSGVDVVKKDSIKKIVKKRIYMEVSVHEKGIKMINIDRSRIIKIPWNQIKMVTHDNKSTTIESLGQEKLTFNGDITALKGLYLITKASMSGLVEKEEGWE